MKSFENVKRDPGAVIKTVIRIFIACLFLSQVACGYSKAVMEPELVGFVEQRPEDAPGIITELPFMYAWRKPLYQRPEAASVDGSYSLYVAPIGTGYLKLEEQDESYRHKVEKIADYFHQQLVTEIKKIEDPERKVRLVQTREMSDAVLEIELTEAGFGNPFLYTLVWLIPFPGIATTYDASYNSVMSFESRFVGTFTGDVLAEVFDRRIPKVRIIDIHKMFSRSAPLREIADDWAMEFARSLTTKIGKESVEGETEFTLIPW